MYLSLRCCNVHSVFSVLRWSTGQYTTRNFLLDQQNIENRGPNAQHKSQQHTNALSGGKRGSEMGLLWFRSFMVYDRMITPLLRFLNAFQALFLPSRVPGSHPFYVQLQPPRNFQSVSLWTRHKLHYSNMSYSTFGCVACLSYTILIPSNTHVIADQN